MSEEESTHLLRPKHMSESYASFELPLASDAKLYERYVNASGGFRELSLYRQVGHPEIQEWASSLNVKLSFSSLWRC